ncbi:MAG TPA: hypothetical protein VJW95_01035 [Dissulfurispiraceae bacterium]|nr:hypothetical protein [Dissulfurispiraceae bacterium]
MSFWTKVKKDLQTGVDEGLAFVKEGAAVVMRKAEALTDEGKKRYILYEMKSKVQKEIADLGGKVYDLSAKMKNPMLDTKIKEITARIKRFEAEILKMEGKQASAAKKTVAKKTAAKKTGAKKAPAKKAATTQA